MIDQHDFVRPMITDNREGLIIDLGQRRNNRTGGPQVSRRLWVLLQQSPPADPIPDDLRAALTKINNAGRGAH